MNDWLTGTQLAANIATVVGLLGVWLAYRQFRAGALAQKQTTAITAWSEYLRLALAHPDLSRPPSWLASATGHQDHSRYRWFVAAMLFACEQVLEAHPDDEAWNDVVASQLRYHHAFLNSQYFDPLVYSNHLGRIAVAVRAETPTLVASGE